MRFLGMYAPRAHMAGPQLLEPDNIEDNAMLAGNTQMLSHSFILHGYEHEVFSPVVIRKGAIIGNNVCILSGVTIGENSVIGAGAVVTSDIPPNCLAVGVPAKPIKYFKFTRTKEENLPSRAHGHKDLYHKKDYYYK